MSELPERDPGGLHDGDAAGADQEIGLKSARRHAEQVQMADAAAHERTGQLHSGAGVGLADRHHRPVRHARGERRDIWEQIGVAHETALLRPESTERSIIRQLSCFAYGDGSAPPGVGTMVLWKRVRNERARALWRARGHRQQSLPRQLGSRCPAPAALPACRYKIETEQPLRCVQAPGCSISSTRVSATNHDLSANGMMLTA